MAEGERAALYEDPRHIAAFKTGERERAAREAEAQGRIKAEKQARRSKA
jgi:hypothetical protein